jgi:hypothetical protein
MDSIDDNASDISLMTESEGSYGETPYQPNTRFLSARRLVHNAQPTTWQEVDTSDLQRLALNIARNATPAIAAADTPTESIRPASRLTSLSISSAADNAASGYSTDDPLGLGTLDLRRLMLIKQRSSLEENTTTTTTSTPGVGAIPNSSRSHHKHGHHHHHQALFGSHMRRKIVPSEESFDPDLYLGVIHRDSTPEELLRGLRHLQTELSQHTGDLKALVKENFDRFIASKLTVDDVYVRLKKTEAGGEAHGASTAEIAATMNELQTEADRAFSPLLQRQAQADKITQVLGLLKQYESLVGLPARVAAHADAGEGYKVATEYKRAKTLLAAAASKQQQQQQGGEGGGVSLESFTSTLAVPPSSSSYDGVWSRLVEEVDRVAATVVYSLEAAIRNAHLTPEEAIDVVKQLEHLKACGVPAAQSLRPADMYIRAQRECVLEIIETAVRQQQQQQQHHDYVQMQPGSTSSRLMVIGEEKGEPPATPDTVTALSTKNNNNNNNNSTTSGGGGGGMPMSQNSSRLSTPVSSAKRMAGRMLTARTRTPGGGSGLWSARSAATPTTPGRIRGVNAASNNNNNNNNSNNNSGGGSNIVGVPTTLLGNSNRDDGSNTSDGGTAADLHPITITLCELTQIVVNKKVLAIWRFLRVHLQGFITQLSVGTAGTVLSSSAAAAAPGVVVVGGVGTTSPLEQELKASLKDGMAAVDSIMKSYKEAVVNLLAVAVQKNNDGEEVVDDEMMTSFDFQAMIKTLATSNGHVSSSSSTTTANRRHHQQQCEPCQQAQIILKQLCLQVTHLCLQTLEKETKEAAFQIPIQYETYETVRQTWKLLSTEKGDGESSSNYTPQTKTIALLSSLLSSTHAQIQNVQNACTTLNISLQSDDIKTTSSPSSSSSVVSTILYQGVLAYAQGLQQCAQPLIDQLEAEEAAYRHRYSVQQQQRGGGAHNGGGGGSAHHTGGGRGRMSAHKGLLLLCSNIITVRQKVIPEQVSKPGNIWNLTKSQYKECLAALEVVESALGAACVDSWRKRLDVIIKEIFSGGGSSSSSTNSTAADAPSSSSTSDTISLMMWEGVHTPSAMRPAVLDAIHCLVNAQSELALHAPALMREVMEELGAGLFETCTSLLNSSCSPLLLPSQSKGGGGGGFGWVCQLRLECMFLQGALSPLCGGGRNGEDDEDHNNNVVYLANVDLDRVFDSKMEAVLARLGGSGDDGDIQEILEWIREYSNNGGEEEVTAEGVNRALEAMCSQAMEGAAANIRPLLCM